MSDSRRLVLLELPCMQRKRAAYVADALSGRWQEEGWTLQHCADPSAPPESGALAFLHVDLTRVPEPYARQAALWPACINARALDIGKDKVSRHAVSPRQPAPGPVIVKTRLNHGGTPEAKHARWARPHPQPLPWPLARLRRLARAGRQKFFPSPRGPKNYTIYPSLRHVPSRFWKSDSWHVERFLPERFHGQYVLREWYFLGAAECTTAELGDDPLITTGEHRLDLASPPPGPLRTLRRELGLDYGKIDYALTDEGPVVYDANKTPAFADPSRNPATVRHILDHLAPGLDSFRVPS